MTEKKPRRPRGQGGIRNIGTERRPMYSAYYWLVIDGKRRQITRQPFARKGDAEKWLKDELQRVREGRPTLPSNTSMSELLDEWLAQRKPSLEPNTYNDYAGMIERRLKPHLGHHRVKHLRPNHLVTMLDALRRPGANRRGKKPRPLSETSLQHTYDLLHVVLDYAVRQRLVAHNVTADVDRPRRQPREVEVWSARQLAVFLDSCGDDRLFPLLQLASHTGARRSELLALRWASVDLAAGTVSIASRRTRVGYEMVHRPGTKTAAGARVIDLDPTTIDVLRSWRKAQDAERDVWGEGYVDSGYVFTAESGEPVHADHVANRYDRLVAAAPVPALHFHGLRHTHATLLLKAGVPVHVVAQRLGHSSPALTLSIYSHVLPRQQAAAAAAFARLVAARPCSECGEPLGDVDGDVCESCLPAMGDDAGDPPADPR
jgi:integrase